MTAVRGPLARLLVVLSVLAACSPAPPPPESLTPPSAAVSATTVESPTAGATPGFEVSVPGLPYTSADLLNAMRESRRPGGVPEELQTEDVAGALAAAIWTYAGQPYPVLVVGASCGPDRCTIEVTGTPAGAAGPDLYAFSVTPGTGALELLDNDLHGYPAELDAILDRVTRDELDASRLSGLALTGATWLLPPGTGTFRALYRSGGEEASHGMDVLVDLRTGHVLESVPR